MCADGGVHADIDAEALKPVSYLSVRAGTSLESDMIVGIEIDQPEFRNHPILDSNSISFCHWTSMCKQRLPLIFGVVEGILG